MHLRLQDFKSVSEYNSALFKISSQLKLCGEKITDEDMLEKTYTTFHASNVLLQQQYRERKFTKYSELISCLLVAEQNNELLLKTTSLARPALHHSQKWMVPHLIIIEEIMVVGMDVVGKIRIKEYVLKIFQKGIPHLTTRSGIIMKHDNKGERKMNWNEFCLSQWSRRSHGLFW